MAALNDSKEDTDSSLKRSKFSRSLSYSGGKKSASFKANHSSSFTGLEELQNLNEARKNVFDGICTHLRSLHNEPLSLRDWEQFEVWCINDEEKGLSNITTSSEAADVYQKCRLLMVDLYGQLPDKTIWKEAKEWYMALHSGSSHQKKTHDMREDKHHLEEIPMDTTEPTSKLKFLEGQHHLEIPTKSEDPKSRTMIAVEQLRQDMGNDMAELKKKVENLEKEKEGWHRENLELTRRGYGGNTWRQTDVGGQQMDSVFVRRSSPIPYHEQEHQSSVGENQTFVEHKERDIDKKLEALRMECEQLTRENMQKTQEINNLKLHQEKTSNRVEELEGECGQLHMDMKNKDIHTEREISRSHEEYKKLQNDAQNKLLSRDKEIQRLEEEKADALRRLSTLASAKLSDNNPDITDLSDMNRPQKIAEKYSELYDNEWTDSYEYLTSNGQDHKKAVAILLNMLESCFQYCKAVGRQQYDYLFMIACSPSFDQKDKDLGPAGGAVQMVRQMITQKVVELRKVAFQQSLKAIRQTYKTDKGRDFVQWTNKEISLYLDKCLEVSWLACIQDPPLEIVSDFPPFSKVDLNIVRKYTKSGEYVDYVIWPALLLSDDGALLSKGVVQCTSQFKDDGAHPPPADQQMRQRNFSNQDDYVHV
ncbi:putative leucine-rich repeat-containing protein DDB_G0290503 isoform X2 [Pecten maximus]|uniref:putative leucine-rich repeat-containing protein DDB_G0290503 isoform X2 n=1 Tax=Pecten maximus TaxID=6579 RepID=UPI001458427F|nr:putative leucine-rich repeat-containing protein DDB_G0290503 isoform X2 [Pecten maximus]